MAKIKWNGGINPVPGKKVRVWFEDEQEAVELADNLSWYWDNNGRIGDIHAYEVMDDSPMRSFETGATRSADTGKPDYEGYLSPLVIERFGQYMTEHRKQADGGLRDSDNWQKGIPQSAYIKSCFRHFLDWWKHHRGHHIEYGIEETLCAVMFNTMGYLHEHLKEMDVRKNKGLGNTV